MDTSNWTSVYAGLSGLSVANDSYDLGHGVTISKTYAHLMAPFMMAFKPAPPGGFHPAPWKAATGGFSFDVTAELHVRCDEKRNGEQAIELFRNIVFLIRLGVTPGTTIPVFSNHSFSQESANNHDAVLIPFEVFPRYFKLGSQIDHLNAGGAEWLTSRWRTVDTLVNQSKDFKLARDAIDAGQFQQNNALTLVSLWGALEALFCGEKSELSFRVSSLIASFLQEPGNDRAILQREVAKLYNKRSAAAHGKPDHELEDVLRTFNLLRSAMLKMIDMGRVPTRDELKARLYGADIAND